MGGSRQQTDRIAGVASTTAVALDARAVDLSASRAMPISGRRRMSYRPA
jgi:hypothetical protein